MSSKFFSSVHEQCMYACMSYINVDVQTVQRVRVKMYMYDDSTCTAKHVCPWSEIYLCLHLVMLASLC